MLNINHQGKKIFSVIIKNVHFFKDLMAIIISLENQFLKTESLFK